MAFHLHLINGLLDHVSAAAPKFQPACVRAPEPPLCLRWKLGRDGRPNARWVRG